MVGQQIADRAGDRRYRAHGDMRPVVVVRLHRRCAARPLVVGTDVDRRRDTAGFLDAIAIPIVNVAGCDTAAQAGQPVFRVVGHGDRLAGVDALGGVAATTGNPHRSGMGLAS